jgi:hypothetical protein
LETDVKDSIEFKDSAETLSVTLTQLIRSIEGKTVSLRDLMAIVGEQGMLLVCAIAALPFLIPVSIPGVSTVFGAGIILISLAVAFNRLPWLPRSILDRELNAEKLVPALEKGVNFVSRFDRFFRRRLSVLTTGAGIARLNGLAITFAGVLLMLPLGLIPFSNTLPAIAILLLATGIIQRDGLVLLLGYLFIVFTVIYFAALAWAAVAAGTSLMDFLK